MNIDLDKLEDLKRQLQKEEEDKCRRLLDMRRQKVSGDDILKDSNPGGKTETRHSVRHRELPEEVREKIYEVMQKLKAGNSEQQFKELEAELLFFGSEAITPIIMWIPTVDYDVPAVRQVLVQVIESMVLSDEQAREAMLEKLENGVPVVKKLLCRVCGMIKAYDARDILVKLSREPVLYYDACSALVALRALENLPDILEAVERVNTDVKSECRLAWFVMCKVSMLGKEAVLPLMKYYVKCQVPEIRPMYTDAIVRIGDEVIPVLAKLLESPEYCREAVMVLGKMKNPVAVDCLLNALEKGVGERRWVLHGLSRTGDPRCEEIFEKLLKSKTLTPAENSELILALGNLGYAEANLYRKFLATKDRGLYLDAAMALAQIGDEKGYSLLLSVVISGVGRDRDKAITHLGRLKNEAVKRILPIMEVENSEKSVFLVQALTKTHVINNDTVLALTSQLRRAGEELRLEIYRYFASHAEASRRGIDGSKSGNRKEQKIYWNKVALDVLYKGRQIEKSRYVLEFLNKSIESATKDTRGIPNIVYREVKEVDYN